MPWDGRASGALLGVLLASPAAAEPIAIVGAKVITKPGTAATENATVVIDHGKITAVGAGVATPAVARPANSNAPRMQPRI